MTITKKTVKASSKRPSVAAPPRNNNELQYEKDFYKWVDSQVKFLRKKEFSKLDIDNLIEEIESLGRSEKRTLRSYLEILLMQMLKVKFQSLMHTGSWDRSIKVAAHKAQTTLSENPSLKPELKKIVEDAYFSARLEAVDETGLDENTFPEKCPWLLEEIFPDLEKKYW